jgi:hypothetical protein
MSSFQDGVLRELDRIAAAVEAEESDSADALQDALDALTALDARRGFGIIPTVVAAGLLVTADKAYWVYQGYVSRQSTFQHVRVALITAAVGTQAAEVALASSPLAPNRSSQVLTKIASDGTLGDLTGSAGLYTNTTGMAAVVPAGTHLWAGFRANFTSTPTQPTLLARAADFGQGEVLSTVTAGALTLAGPWTGATIAHALTAMCPVIVATKD